VSLVATFPKIFGTATWRREQAQVFARERFPDFDQRAATIVLDCLVDTLSIRFQQLHSGTDLAKDLGADEDEPEWIAMSLNEKHQISFSPVQVAEAHTVRGLIELVTKALHEQRT
jgi:hypothetical protein